MLLVQPKICQICYVLDRDDRCVWCLICFQQTSQLEAKVCVKESVIETVIECRAKGSMLMLMWKKDSCMQQQQLVFMINHAAF